MAGTPTPGFKAVTPLTSFPTAGNPATSVAAASRLDLDDAGWTSIDFHVGFTEADTGDYALLRYWADDATWRMERPPVTFDSAANSSIAPCGIPTGGGSFALLRTAGAPASEFAVMKACIRR